MIRLIDIGKDIGPFVVPAAQRDGAAVIAILQAFDGGNADALRHIQPGDRIKKRLSGAARILQDALTPLALDANKQLRRCPVQVFGLS